MQRIHCEHKSDLPRDGSIYRVLFWFFLAGSLLALEFLSGQTIQKGTLFFAVVLLAAWFDGWWGLVFAVGMPLVQVGFLAAWGVSWSIPELILNTLIHMTGLALLAYFVGRTRRQLQEIRILRGFLPICSFCKKIRNREQHWIPLEAYISAHSEAKFSHGVCPECVRTYYAEVADQVEERVAGKI